MPTRSKLALSSPVQSPATRLLSAMPYNPSQGRKGDSPSKLRQHDPALFGMMTNRGVAVNENDIMTISESGMLKKVTRGRKAPRSITSVTNCKMSTMGVTTSTGILLLAFMLWSSAAFSPGCVSIGPLKTGRGPTCLRLAPTVQETTKDAEQRMSKSIDAMVHNLGSVRTGRANAAMLDRVKCEYYGAETPIYQMATIAAPSAQQLTVDPFDKSTLGDIERAIAKSGLGITPQSDGTLIRLNVPPLSEDRRKGMLKQCKAIGEEGKVSVRNVRRACVDAIKKLEKGGEISKDESKNVQTKIQKVTDKKITAIDGIIKEKEKELLTI